jgi:hypothetical protein
VVLQAHECYREPFLWVAHIVYQCMRVLSAPFRRDLLYSCHPWVRWDASESILAHPKK